jgi:hypothetical protein
LKILRDQCLLFYWIEVVYYLNNNLVFKIHQNSTLLKRIQDWQERLIFKEAKIDQKVKIEELELRLQDFPEV